MAQGIFRVQSGPGGLVGDRHRPVRPRVPVVSQQLYLCSGEIVRRGGGPNFFQTLEVQIHIGKYAPDPKPRVFGLAFRPRRIDPLNMPLCQFLMALGDRG